MARTFRRKQTAHPLSELNVTNLVDLAFVLLIVFMIATPLIEQEQTMPVNLPVASVSTQPQSTKERTESITVKADGSVLLGMRQMTVAALTVELARFAAEPKPPIIHLRLDAAATAQQYLTVFDELRKANLSRVSFDYQTTR